MEERFSGFIKAVDAKYPGITVKATSVSQVARNGSNPAVITSIYVTSATFAKAGVQVPANHRVASFDGFVTLAGMVQKAGYQGLAFGPADGYRTTGQLDSFLQTSAPPRSTRTT